MKGENGQAEAHVSRALAARARGELEEARAELDAALRKRPDGSARELRAEVLSELGYVAEALADLDAALRKGPRADLYARRAQFHLQRRFYPEALADLDRAVRLAPRDPALFAKRAEMFALTDRLSLALKDLDAAARLAPADEALRLGRLRVLIERGDRARAKAEISRLMGQGSERSRQEAVFLRGCLAFKLREKGLGGKDFKSLMGALREDDRLSMRARFYWVASRSVDPAFRRRHRMKTDKNKPAKLFLCGLGIFPPYTASMEVLHALSRCDVLFDNIAGSEVRSFLSEFCADVRPAAYQAAEDEPRWAGAIFKELRRGRTVGFVTRGHPLVFGALAVELVERAREAGIKQETFGAVSSIDHLLAYTGQGLGVTLDGIQALDRPAVERAAVMNTGVPLLVGFAGGLRNKTEIAAFRRSLERFYPAAHGCWMFGPKYDGTPAVLSLGELDKRYKEIHASLMLYLPPLAAGGKAA